MDGTLRHDTRKGIDGRGRVARLVERFTAERSIKWVLGIGVVLMFGSSLMLVTSHWEDISSTSKLGVFLAYTAALWGAGEATRRRPGLRLTSSTSACLTSDQ